MADVQTVATQKPRFHRILLKLSGEALAPAQNSGIDLDALSAIALEIKEVAGLGVQLALVIGAGNILRGSAYEERGIARPPIRWGCWRRLSTRSRYRTRSNRRE